MYRMHPQYYNNNQSVGHKSIWRFIPFIIFFFFILPRITNMPVWMMFLFIFLFFKFLRFGFYGSRHSNRSARYGNSYRSQPSMNTEQAWNVPIIYDDVSEKQAVSSIEATKPTKLETPHNFCIECGVKIVSNLKFCPNCGTNQLQ